MKVLKEVITTYIEEDGKIKITEAPLVRCGECKWLYRDTDNEEPWCGIWANATKENAFCSYGERRTEQSQINTIENTTEERVKMYCYDMRISTDERERK